jgi:hypothetical protein
MAPRTRLLAAGLLALLASTAAGSCSCDDAAETATSTGDSTAAPSATGGGGDDGSGGSADQSASLSVGSQSGAGGSDGCANQEAEATVEVRPVDIVFVIDNSGSMSGEIFEVEAEISANFATLIEAAQPPIDYRVIMVSGFGNWEGQRICIPAPLGGVPDDDGDGHCDETGNEPVNGERFFHHDAEIDSHDALCQLLEQYDTPDEHGLNPGGYRDRLRPEAVKVFVVITDDNVDTGGGDCPDMDDGNDAEGGEQAAATFDDALLDLDFLQFGTLDQRNYIFHSIVALAPFDAGNLTVPHPPDAPIVTEECTPDAENPGTGYQALSRLTGGLRYPTCGLDYTPIFQQIAQGIIEGSAVACEFAIPAPPSGEVLDLDSVRVRYEPGDGGAPVSFDQVDGPADCNDTSFYLDESAGTIVLCPGACAAVQADGQANVRIVFDCVDTPD